MCRFTLVSAFALFTILGSNFLLIADEVYAYCCMCNKCRSYCTCPGSSSECEACAAPDASISSKNTTLAPVTLKIRGMREVFPSSLFTSFPKTCAETIPFRLKVVNELYGLFR
jgi:hypothetical protein